MTSVDRKTSIRLICFSKPYILRIVIAASASIIVGGMDGLIAYMIEPLMKKVFSENNTQILQLLPIGVILLFTIRGLCRYANDYFIRTAGQLAVQDVRNKIYTHCLKLNLGVFHKRQTGMLMSRVISDVNMMQDGVAAVVTAVFREGVSAVLLLGVVFYQNWKLAIITFFVIPITVWPAQLIGKKLKSAALKGQEKLGDLTCILQETFSGIKVIKAFALETREIEKFKDTNRSYYSFLRKAFKYEGMSTPVMEMITSLGVAVIIGFGGSMVINGTLTAAKFFSFIGAMIMLFNPIKKLISAYNSAQRSLGAAERVFEVIDQNPDFVFKTDVPPIGRVSGNVVFRSVSFKYEEDYVLRDISFSVRQNEIIALVGPSGSGKTTLVSLISRFYDVSEGAISIDGIDLKNITQGDLMAQIALVDQEIILFNDTIANNIRYGKPSADDAEVEAAAKAAFAHDFIMELPDAYATNIGDRGVRLSGGQRQRVCIARALLKNAPLLILDEATSALDTESEKMVQDALENLMKNRTTFVIAHRLSTVVSADKILVLDQGRIVESGSHQQLLNSSGLYRKLYNMQFQEDGN